MGDQGGQAAWAEPGGCADTHHRGGSRTSLAARSRPVPGRPRAPGHAPRVGGMSADPAQHDWRSPSPTSAADTAAGEGM
jgi:hypothetical protein